MIARRAARAVASCDLEPRGLPESAILIVRRMPDPAPRRLLTDRSHWERKARAKLQQFAAQAIRAPWNEVADSAPAVWFEDRTEMTACFTADLAAGQARHRWWWRIPLRQLGSTTPGSRAIRTLLLREPHAIPEIMRLLEKQSRLETVLRSLSAADLELILRALEQTFAIMPPFRSSHRFSISMSTVVSGAFVAQEAAAERSAERLRLLAAALRFSAGSPSRARLLQLYWNFEQISEDVRTSEPFEKHAAVPKLEPTKRSATVETEWGGVLYLINVMKALDLPRSVHEGITGWALLELMGRCLTGPRSEHDALWRAMATLDGREPGDAPGTSARDPELYRIPDQWPRPAADFVYARARGERLLLHHPSRFPLYDGPFLNGPPVRLLHRRGARSGVPRQTTSALHRLLSFVIPYVRWRLKEALGSDVELERILCIHGMIEISPTHIDAVFDINSVSLPVRMAGLDANPGWIPALGRVVTYYFQ